MSPILFCKALVPQEVLWITHVMMTVVIYVFCLKAEQSLFHADQNMNRMGGRGGFSPPVDY